jgi:hypothetical protein
MATKQSGGVSPFGWTLLGFLAGVAATLAIQLILVGRGRGENPEEPAHAAPVVAVTPQLPAPRHKAKLAETAESATAAAPPAKAVVTPDQQVAEDAAATGMTTRAAPQAAASEPPR